MFSISQLRLQISFLKLINNTLIFKQYLKKSEDDCSQIFLNLILIFYQNMDELGKQVQTLESVHPLIFKYRQACQKRTRLCLVFSTCLSIFRNQRKNILVFKLLLNALLRHASLCYYNVIKLWFQGVLSELVHIISNWRMCPNFDVSAPPTFVTEFSNKLESLNIKLVAA